MKEVSMPERNPLARPVNVPLADPVHMGREVEVRLLDALRAADDEQREALGDALEDYASHHAFDLPITGRAMLDHAIALLTSEAQT